MTNSKIEQAERLRSSTATGGREEIARIIDPEGFSGLQSERAWAAQYDKPDSFWAPWQRRCDEAQGFTIGHPGIKRRATDEIERLTRENKELRDADRDHLSAKQGMEKRLTERALAAESKLLLASPIEGDVA